MEPPCVPSFEGIRDLWRLRYRKKAFVLASTYSSGAKDPSTIGEEWLNF